ncbi:sugar phosphate isomerase/epimerase family protein [Desulfoplanes sp.]
MSFFVAFPMRLLAHNKNIFDTCVTKKVNVEIGFDAQTLDNLDLGYHTFLSGEFYKAGLTCAVHLPFFDLHPGSPDPLIRKGSRKRLTGALEIAKIYHPAHLVAHTGFQENYADCFSEWSTTALETWRRVLSVWPDHPCIYFENVYSREPGVMCDFLSELHSERCRFCMDVGHWFSFARGANSRNFSLWLQKLGPFLGHVHLHDNCGLRDRHLGMGAGNIPWDEVFSSLELMELEPTITLEPYSSKDLQDSFSFMLEHMAWFSRLGVSKSQLLDIMSTKIPDYF